MNRHLLFAFVACLCVAIGCGDDNGEHPYQTDCETECSHDGVEACEELADDCLETCLSRTESLEGSCGTCVVDHFAVDSTCSEDVEGEETACMCAAAHGSINDCQGFCD